MSRMLKKSNVCIICTVIVVLYIQQLKIKQITTQHDVYHQKRTRTKHVVTTAKTMRNDVDITPVLSNIIEDEDKANEVEQQEEEQKSAGPPVVSVNPLTPSQIVAEYIDSKLVNATDRMKSTIPARLQLMEVAPGTVEEIKTVDISIVVSYCDKSLSWIVEYIGKDFSVKDIAIYSKCGNSDIEGLQQLKELAPIVDVITLPNVGRCDHTFAYWIKEHYKSIDQEMNGNDIVMFLKDNMRYRDTYGIDHVLTQASNSGFGCLIPIGCPCDQCREDGLHATNQQRRDLILRTKKKTYHREERDDGTGFVSDKYANLGEWKEDMGFIIPESETMPVCYRGLFAAQKKQILNQSEGTWMKMETSLSRGNNIEEGHYAERIWGAILSDVDNETARAVDEVLSHYAASISNGVGCGFKAMKYVKISPEVKSSIAL